MEEPVQAALSWFEIGKVVLASGITSAIVTQGIQAIRDKRKSNSSAKFAAIRVISKLDKYSHDVVKEIRAFDRSYDRCLEIQDWADLKQVERPRLDINEGDLEKLEAELSARIAWLQLTDDFATGMLYEDWLNNSDFDDAITDDASVLAYIGREAAFISRSLRENFGLVNHISSKNIQSIIDELADKGRAGRVLAHMSKSNQASQT